MTLVLASASPRRHEILTEAGILHEVVVSEVDESPYYSADPAETVKNLALAKAGAVAQLAGMEERYVLGADTVVYANGEILGKPRDKEDAYRMLRMLSGSTHEVLTGIAVLHGTEKKTRVVRTNVTFRTLSEDVIRDYAESGEPMGKAGAYAIQGKAGLFVKATDGDYKNVIGLPLYALLDLLLDEYRVPARSLYTQERNG